MKVKGFVILSILIVFSGFTTGSGFEDYYGGDPFSIFRAGVDPYQTSIGGISSVISSGGNSSFVNPAGLGTLTSTTIETNINRPFWDVEGSYLGAISFAMPIKFGYGSIGTFGIGVQHYSTGSQVRNIPGEPSINFNPTQTILTFAWGKGFGGNPAFDKPANSFFGFSLNIYRQKLDIYSDSGFGLNIGFYRKLTDYLTVGFKADNLITPKIEMKEVSDSLPFNVKVGVGFFPIEYVGVLSELETDLDGDLKARIGGFFRYGDYFRISSGYETVTEKPSFGVGIKVKNIEVDYAVTLNSHLGMGNQLGISLEL